MGGTLTKGLPVRVAASTPVLVTGWNAVVVVWVARRAHCWVLRQPAAGSGRRGWVVVPSGAGGRRRGRVLEGRVFLEDTGHRVVWYTRQLVW